MSELETLLAQQQAAIERHRAIQTELAKSHFGGQLAAVDAANKALTAAGFATNLSPWVRIERLASEGNWPYLCCSLHGVMQMEPDDAVLRIRLSDAERVACEVAWEEAEVAWREYRDLSNKVREAEAKQHKARKPLSFKRLLALVGKDHDEQEQYYVAQAPRKHEQEEFTGTQVVKMNVDLLIGWLDEAGEDFDNLPADKQRKIWEASAFHFGIMGYREADADHFWR